MRKAVLATLMCLLCSNAGATTVYDFTMSCREERLSACFNRIEEHLERLKAVADGRRFCLPGAWGSSMFSSLEYPVSVLEYVRLAVSAARFGRAERDVDEVMSEVVAGLYPCQ